MPRGTWVAQSVWLRTLSFSSGQDLRVLRLSPTSGSMLSTESACPSPSAPPSPQINKILKITECPDQLNMEGGAQVPVFTTPPQVTI